MRKWMRERLQRRKKKAADTVEQPGPPPLQPAYFNAKPSDPTTSPREGEEQTEAQVSPAPVAGFPGAYGAGSHLQQETSTPSEKIEDSNTAPESRDSAPGSAGNRGRRRRGGRGRGGRREKAAPQVSAPASPRGPSATAMSDSTEAEPAERGGPEIPGEAPATAMEPQPAARPPKGIVVLAIGLPGSGKSTWFKRHKVVPLSSDMMRSLLFDDVREQRYQDLVFSNLRSMLKARLIARRPMNYVDATNLTPHERQHWIKLAKDYNYEVQAVFFDVPLDVCIERHHRRDRVVPDEVMRRMAAKLKAPTFEEGFAKITVVRVKKKPEHAADAELG